MDYIRLVEDSPPSYADLTASPGYGFPGAATIVTIQPSNHLPQLAAGSSTVQIDNSPICCDNSCDKCGQCCSATCTSCGECCSSCGKCCYNGCENCLECFMVVCCAKPGLTFFIIFCIIGASVFISAIATDGFGAIDWDDWDRRHHGRYEG